MPETKTRARFALTLLAATCLTSVAQAAPGDSLGPVFQVSTTPAVGHRSPAIAMDADGDFVVAWQQYFGGGIYGSSEIVARRYNAAGVRQGEKIQVSISTGGRHPSVAIDPDGDFVVAWANGQVFARRYNETGEAEGPAFQVNTTPAGGPLLWPSVAMDADGDFVVAWTNKRGEYGDGWDVFVQRYDAAGEPQGSELQVNTTTAGQQRDAPVAMDADGNFVAIWMDTSGRDGDGWGIFAQRYNAAGEPRGGEFQVNTTTTGNQTLATVAMDADGDFVVVWGGNRQIDGKCAGDHDIFAQRYDSLGNPLGDELQVNSTAKASKFVRVAMDADGDFVVVWDQYCETTDGTFIVRRFDAAANPQGGELRIDAPAFDYSAVVAMDLDGDHVVAWQAMHPSSYLYDYSLEVFAQRFDGAERVEGDFDGDGKADLLWRNPATGQTVVWLMDGDTKLDAGSIGTVPAAWQIAGTGDFNGDGKADVLWRNSATGNAIVWQMNGFEKTAAQSIGTVPLAWTVEQLRDTNGDGLSDIVWRNTATGTTIVWRMSGFTRVAAEPIGSVPADWDLH